jgi:hypothetical protein
MAKKKKESKFKGKVSRNVTAQQQASSSYGYLNLPKGINMFKPEPGGRCTLDFMPYIISDKKHLDRNDEYEDCLVGDLWYKKPFKVHKNVGQEEDSVICLKTFGKPCPICEHRAQLAKEGETDKDTLKELAPKDRVLYCVIPLSGKDPDGKSYEEKPHIMDMSWWLFQDLLNQELEENEDNAVFPDLEEGLSLKIRWDSSTMGKGKPYAEASRIDFEERDEAYDESILKEIPDLDTVLKVLSYKELEAIFFDTDPDEDEDDETEDFDEVEDEEEEEKPRRKKKTARKPEPEEDDDEDDEEEEEEKPRRKKKPARKPEPEEDEEEEEEDDEKEDDEEEEDEEEEKPKRKKAPAKKAAKGKCPYGHKYGVDADEKEECNSCDLWDECLDEKEKNEED